MTGNYLQPENTPLVLSIIAIVVSLASLGASVYMAFLYRKEMRLKALEFEQNQQDRARRNLEITVWHSSKYGDSFDKPLKWLGVWFIVNNRTEEQPLIAELDIIFHFVKRDWLAGKHGLEYLFAVLLGRREEATLAFALYSTFLEWTNISSSHNLPLNFYLLDWETKDPIYFAPQQEYRMPGPGQKRRWYLFGNIPEEDGLRWIGAGLRLKGVDFRFITDQGKIYVKENINTQLLNEDKLEEWSSYSFDFEIAPITIFGPHYPV